MTKFAILALAALALTACSPEPKLEPVDATPVPLEQDDPPVRAEPVTLVSMPTPAAPHARWSSRHIANFNSCVVSELTVDGQRYMVVSGENRSWTPACAIAPVPPST